MGKILEQQIKQELNRANREYPLFASDHEAYAVYYEELEELCTEIDLMIEASEEAWDCVKNDDHKGFLEKMEYIGIKGRLALEELIQVCAMCDKCDKKKCD